MTKVMIGAIVAVVLFFGSVICMKMTRPQEAILGVQTVDEGRKHIAQGKAHEPYKAEFPTSGPHYADRSSPTTWGIHEEEEPDEVLIHNMEHGGVIVTYRPDLPADQIQKLKNLFSSPYSNKDFKPIKVIVIPRSKDKAPITIAAWRYSFNLNQYSEKSLMKFYEQRLGKAPEATLG